MHPTGEEMSANREKNIPVGASVALVSGVFSLVKGEIGIVTKTYRSQSDYQCSIVDFPFIKGKPLPNYILEEIDQLHVWEV